MFAATKETQQEIQEETKDSFDYEKLTGFPWHHKESPSKSFKETVAHVLKVLERNNLQNDINIRTILFGNSGDGCFRSV